MRLRSRIQATASRQPVQRRRRSRGKARRLPSLTWDLAPLMVLATAGVALLQEPGRAKARRHERGRGRLARSPQEIPRRGWKDILLRTKEEFAKDQVPMVAAGVTFYTLLALFPGLAAFVGLYGLFADVGDVQHHLAVLSWVLPPGVLQFIGEQMVRIAEANKETQSLAFAFGLLASIWSANGAVKAMLAGLNIAYEETEKRSFVRKTALSLAFTFGFLALALCGVALLAAQPMLAGFVGPGAAAVVGWVSWPLLLVGLGVGLALLYRFGPDRNPVKWSWISWGSAGVIGFWAAASALFSIYVGNFAHYDRTYGSLGAAVGFMMWIYLSAMVVLAGAELNAEIEHQTTVDTTTIGAPRPLGLRRAVMADTVGPAKGK